MEGGDCPSRPFPLTDRVGDDFVELSCIPMNDEAVNDFADGGMDVENVHWLARVEC